MGHDSKTMKFTKKELAYKIRLRLSREDCLNPHLIPRSVFGHSDVYYIKTYATDEELKLLKQ